MRNPTDRPNIILINCDDLGYGDLGCYGSTANQTPALDRMAAEGTKFSDFYMASPICSPSRGAMMTGCYPPRIGFDMFHPSCGVLFPGSPDGLHPDEITIADVLRDQGYATKLVGKWHCGDQPEFLPTNHGFDSYYGLPYSNDMGRQLNNPDRPPLPLLRDDEVIQQQPDMGALTERYAEESVRFLRENCDRPFFLYLAHMHVHVPHIVAEAFLRRSTNGRYGGAVAAIDWSVSVLMAELRALGIDENTLMVFTSDNGSRARAEGGSNAPLRGTKATTWEGGLRVPCIARWPGQVPAGRTSAELVTSMEFMPTFARFAGTTEPQDRIIDGCDIGPVLLGESGAKSPRDTFFYYHTHNLDAVRRGPWKLFVRRNNAPDMPETGELYNLADDIGETNNVADQHPDIVAELKQAVAECRDDMGDAATGTEGRNRRPAGWVDDAKPLTEYDPDHPYIVALYDTTECG